MSAAKSKLGRDPFGGKTKPAHGRGPKKAAKRKSEPRERVHRRSRRRSPPGLNELFKEITHYWVPRVRACVYMRALKAFSRFTA